MSIPISIKELDDWTKGIGEQNSELATWLNLLGFQGKSGLTKFLKEPFSKDKDTSLMLLRSWFGRKLFQDFGNLVYIDSEKSEESLFQSLEKFLNGSQELNVLNFFRSVPSEVIYLNLDEIVKVAKNFRYELNKQQKLVSDLREISQRKENISERSFADQEDEESNFEIHKLKVNHRIKPLNIEIWRPTKGVFRRQNLVVFMPGLGGDQAHFQWLARNLSQNGWPVILLEHPGSDSQSIKALLEGKKPAPGFEVIPDRLADIYSVVQEIQSGTFQLPQSSIVLMGHSLGSLTAFLAAGAKPELGLTSTCDSRLENFSLANLSELLQCELVDFSLIEHKDITSLKAIVGINSFGSRIWTRNSKININLPVFLTGGTFDLVTPAIYEQLQLFLATKKNRFSRVLLIEGASHFSPIRVKKKINKSIDNDVFKLSKSLVGYDPQKIQKLLAQQIINFLDNLEAKKIVPVNTNVIKNQLRFHILDRLTIKKLVKN
tara:strand:+ start:7522 stop:8991 length:1470 start_codon:yes stop_codon:yes gene_type:complete